MDVTVTNTERLSFRLLDPQEPADIKLLWSLDQDPQVMRFINGGNPTSVEDMDSIFVPRLNAYRNPQKGWGMWGVFDATNTDFFGWILVRPMHFFSAQRDDSDLELGWRFTRSSWGKGIATEAANTIMMALYQQTQVAKYSAIAVSDNLASIAIMKKLGMSFVSSGVHKDPLGDMLVDTYAVTFADR